MTHEAEIAARTPGPAGARRAGVSVLELILVLPILIIILLAVVEFSLLLGNLKQLAMASRVGAEVASQTDALPGSGDVPAAVINAVQQQLITAGIVPCRIILQHNVGGGAVELSTGIDPACDCDAPTTPDLPPSGTYVRLTICTRLDELTLNLLSTLGFDISQRMAEHSTTYMYEP